jgi:uncharacterized protein YhhL (DUF1145 family)
MADDKKKPAAAPAPTGGFPPDDLERLKLIGWVLAILIVLAMGLLMRLGTDEDGSLNLPPAGDIRVGEEVANRKEAQVRAAPGGAILGVQEKRLFGTVMEGPEEFGGRRWWRVNYEEAPDGWVDESKITATIWLFVLINIVPFALEILLPISIVLCIILVILRMIVRSKASGVTLVNAAEEQEFLARTNRIHILKPVVAADGSSPATTYKPNERWIAIERMSESMNANDWRQAIIEADIVLEEMLDRIGYDGLTVADKLKNVEPSDFRTLQEAWQAHKVRNRIAHDGSAFQLDHVQAKRVIGLYRQVFEEFYYI